MKYLRGSDGRTPYQRFFGKHVHEESCEFGERVLWKTRPSKDVHVLVEAAWQEGLWLGHCWGAVGATPCRNPVPAVGEEPPEVLLQLQASERAPAQVPDEARRAVKSIYIRNEDRKR